MDSLVTYFTSELFVIEMIIIIFGVAYIKKDKNIVTMIGIFGTFIGIIAGLYGFDVKNIDSSIPTLIGGLKTAFLTSIAGLTASIIISYFSTEESGEEDELSVLKELLLEVKKMNENVGLKKEMVVVSDDINE